MVEISLSFVNGILSVVRYALAIGAILSPLSNDFSTLERERGDYLFSLDYRLSYGTYSPLIYRHLLTT